MGTRNHGFFLFFVLIMPVYLVVTIVMMSLCKPSNLSDFWNKATCDGDTLPPCIFSPGFYLPLAYRIGMIVISVLAGAFVPPTM